MTETRPHLRVTLRAISALILLLIMGACSSTSSSSVSASDAASTVAAVFQLPADQQTCLEHQFGDHAGARQVFSGHDVASSGDLQQLGQVESACIPPDTLAEAVTNGVSDGFGGTLTDVQRSCLRDGVGGLSDGDRNKLLVGLVVSNSGALDAAGIAELGQVTNGLLDTCHLDIATTQTRPGSTDDTAGDPTVTSPTSGPTG
ncbi:MAG: hypothetical protein ACXWA3_11285 [Acidimicrobiales bacterium]